MLINASVYEEGKELPGAHTWPEALAAALETKRFGWVGLQNATPEEIDSVSHHLELHDLVTEDLKTGHQMPKLEEYPNYIFIVCKQAKWSKEGGLEEGDVSLVVNKKNVVTFRRGVGDGFSTVRNRARMEPELLGLGAGYVLYAVLDTVVDRYFPIVKNLEAEFERLEDKVFSEDIPGQAPQDIPRDQLTRSLYHLRREVVRFRGLVEPLLEVTVKLFGGRVPALCDGLGDYFRDIHDHLMRIVARLDTLYATMGSAVQAQLALTTIEEGKVTKRLAAYASIFAADTLWVGLWGMNFKHMPELDWKYGYPTALTVIAVTSFVLFRQFRKRGWL